MNDVSFSIALLPHEIAAEEPTEVQVQSQQDSSDDSSSDDDDEGRIILHYNPVIAVAVDTGFPPDEDVPLPPGPVPGGGDDDDDDGLDDIPMPPGPPPTKKLSGKLNETLLQHVNNYNLS